jgi:2,5-diketo-D-gluconate reductase A
LGGARCGKHLLMSIDTSLGIADVPSVALNDGREMPQVGFGVFKVPADETAEAVTTALQAGYRAIDTAAAYRNEAAVGEAIRASGLASEDVFVTTKVWSNDQGAERTRTAFAASLERLGLDHVDLYLIHWPAAERGLYSETWRTLVEFRDDGRARSIGVSNFHPDHLRRIVDDSGVVPAVNQIELHPRLQQRKLRRLHAELGIVTEAWAPLARGHVLDDPAVTALAGKHERTPAQIVLRWHVQLGNVVIPKSVTPERIRANIDLFGFELDDGDMRSLEALDAGERTGPHPDRFGG